MSDPRFTDSADRRTRQEPRVDTTLDPIQRGRSTGGSVWGWVAGIAVLILIAFILLGGGGGGGSRNGGGTNTAANPPASAPTTTPAPGPATTGQAPAH